MTATFGQGVQVQVGDGGTPESFTEIPGAGTVNFTPPSREQKEVTSHSSPSGDREYIPGLKAQSQVKFPVYWDDANPTHARLWTLSQGLVNGNFKLIYPDPKATTFQFAAQVKVEEISGPVEDALQMTVRLTVSGAVAKS